MAITSANQLELLQTAEAVAREKMIDPSLVVEAMEESLARAAKSRYGSEMDIRVSIDRKTGRATFTRIRTVVTEEEVENYQAEMTVEQARQYMENPEIGQQYIEEIPPVDMGRIAAQFPVFPYTVSPVQLSFPLDNFLPLLHRPLYAHE